MLFYIYRNANFVLRERFIMVVIGDVLIIVFMYVFIVFVTLLSEHVRLRVDKYSIAPSLLIRLNK